MQKVKQWYENIGDSDVFQARRGLVRGHEMWFAATMILEFAVRNSDIARISWQNFIEHDGCIYLNYTPHKTAHSSGRMVKWPVHALIWERLKGHGNLPEVAVMSQASQVKWSSGALTNPDGDSAAGLRYWCFISSDTSDSTAVGKLLTVAAGDWTAITAAPEPTSGLLLLLGVAGLALRRRRA